MDFHLSLLVLYVYMYKFFSRKLWTFIKGKRPSFVFNSLIDLGPWILINSFLDQKWHTHKIEYKPNIQKFGIILFLRVLNVFFENILFKITKNISPIRWKWKSIYCNI